MTLDQWLQEATGTFPRGVRERLRQEYTAHLEDSVGAGGSVDAQELFGDPDKVAKDLTRLYVTSDRLKLLENMSGGWYCFMLLISVLYSPYTLTYQTSILNIFYFVTEIVLLLLIILCTSQWKRAQKTVFRHQMIMAVVLLFNSSSQTFRNPLNYIFNVAFVILILGVIWNILETFKDSRRIQRTLSIEDTEFEVRRHKIHF